MTWHRGHGDGHRPVDPALRADRRVHHAIFGDGMVVSVENNRDGGTVTVEFAAPFGIKRLRLAYTNLTILDPDPPPPAA